MGSDFYMYNLCEQKSALLLITTSLAKLCVVHFRHIRDGPLTAEKHNACYMHRTTKAKKLLRIQKLGWVFCKHPLCEMLFMARNLTVHT